MQADQGNTAYRRMTPRRALELAAPHTWPAAVVPTALGTLLALSGGSPFRPLRFLLTLAAAVLLQSAVNTFNDLRDFLRGADTLDNCRNPGDAAMLYGRLRPRAALALGLGFLLLAAAAGTALSLLAGWRVWLFGAAGALGIALYAAGASDLPVGELLSGLCMGGVLPLAACWAQAGRCGRTALYALLPSVLCVACIMLANNTADTARDAAAGRRTLAVLLGPARAQRLLCALLLIALLSVCALCLARFPGGWAALPPVCAGALLAARPLYLGPIGPDSRDRCMAAALGAHEWIAGGFAAAIALSLL
ncbi:MAG: UbiA family prenyltransferase [Clostridia bacterium]|nr:UbiA family prenyltransferase [Clostridia bacterium]